MSGFPHNSTATYPQQGRHFTPLPADHPNGVSADISASDDDSASSQQPEEDAGHEIFTDAYSDAFSDWEGEGEWAIQPRSADDEGAPGIAHDGWNFAYPSDDDSDYLYWPGNGDQAPGNIPMDERSVDLEGFSPLARPLSADLDDVPFWPINAPTHYLDDSLSIDFSQLELQAHATPSYLASPARTLSPQPEGAPPRDVQPLPFSLDITTDWLDSHEGQQILLMGCRHEHNASPHGGYQQ